MLYAVFVCFAYLHGACNADSISNRNERRFAPAEYTTKPECERKKAKYFDPRSTANMTFKCVAVRRSKCTPKAQGACEPA